VEERKEPTHVTQLQLVQHTDKIKQELQGEIKIVSQSVMNLERIVLPMVVSLEAIKENTGEMTSTMKEFVKEQKEHREKLHTHDISINELQRDDDVKLEKEKGKWQFLTILGGGLLGAGGVVTVFSEQITELAKWIFGGR
jgi:hypothetical protein